MFAAVTASLTALPPGSRAALRVTRSRDLLSAGLPRPGILALGLDFLRYD